MPTCRAGDTLAGNRGACAGRERWAQSPVFYIRFPSHAAALERRRLPRQPSVALFDASYTLLTSGQAHSNSFLVST
jgi:hypothetical protein